MKRKTTLIILSVVCAIFCALSLTACDTNETHTHNYRWIDNGDGTHKQHCDNGGCDAPDIDTDSHDFSNGDCVCGAKKPASEVEADYELRYAEYDTSCSVIGINTTSDSNNVVIPSTHNGKPVTSIAKSAFYNCTSLTSITVPDSVTNIGLSAFMQCENLTSMVLPFIGANKEDSEDNYLGYIFGAQSVGNTPSFIPSSLKTVTVTGDGNIHGSAFYSCSGLVSVTILGNTGVEEYAFGGCGGLTIYCKAASKPQNWDDDWNPDGCPVIWDCENNNKDGNGYEYAVINGIRYRLKDGVATAYKQPTSISGNVVMPASITHNDKIFDVEIGESAFADCEDLAGITIPNGITSIRERAFSRCRNLTDIVIPNSVESIDEAAFYYCNGLTDITIPYGVENIGKAAFYHCDGLTDITVPDSVKNIGESAFSMCDNLASITIPFVGANEDGIGNTNFGYIFGTDSYDYYRGSVPSSLKTVIITGGNHIDIGAFNGCYNLTDITIPNSVKNIGASAFNNCSSLKSITIPDSITYIGEYAFNGCNNLQYNELGDALYLGNAANPHVALIKVKNTSIASCTLPDNTKVIYGSAFANCGSLTSITIPDGLTCIGEYAFNGCSKLNAVTIPDGVTVIKAGTFYGCGNLTNITVPNGVTTIGASSFYGCSGLSNISIPNSVTNIENNAFNGCTRLTSITFNGTKEQWYAITIGFNYDYNTGNYTIRCTNGDIAKI